MRTHESLVAVISSTSSCSPKSAVALAVRIPAAAQSTEGSNGSSRSFGLCLSLRVTHLKQTAVSIQNLDQADNATLVSGERVLACTRERGFALCEDLDLSLAFDERRQGVLHFLGRP